MVDILIYAVLILVGFMIGMYVGITWCVLFAKEIYEKIEKKLKER